MQAGLAARKAGMSGAALGQITGDLRVTEGESEVTLGLGVKLSSKGLHVPDCARPGPEGRGWAYSQDVCTALKQYKVS